MASPKVKTMSKEAGKPIEKPIAKMKKTKKKHFQSFSSYIYRLLRTLAPANIGIKRKTMLIMNNFVTDMLEKIAFEASKLMGHEKKQTLTRREIQAATRLLIPGELAKHANIEAMKAISLYHNSK